MKWEEKKKGEKRKDVKLKENIFILLPIFSLLSALRLVNLFGKKLDKPGEKER